MVLLRLVDEDGITGLGEAVPMSLRGGTGLEQVFRQLTDWCTMPGTRMSLSPPAQCAIETALSDLEARRREIPLWKLLDGSTSPRSLRCNATITAGDAADVFRQCESWADDGFTVFKLKAGPDEAVNLARTIRDRLDVDVRIRIDANGTWGDKAEVLLAELEPYEIELVEEPVHGLTSLAELSHRSDIPLVADESVNDVEQAAEAAVLGSCRAATVKLSKIGGLGVDLGGHLPTYLSSALDGPVGIAAAAHAAQILPPELPWPDMAHGLATERLFENSISASEPLLDGPWLTPPPGPGLGVEIDEDALRSARL